MTSTKLFWKFYTLKLQKEEGAFCLEKDVFGIVLPPNKASISLGIHGVNLPKHWKTSIIFPSYLEPCIPWGTLASSVEELKSILNDSMPHHYRDHMILQL